MGSDQWAIGGWINSIVVSDINKEFNAGVYTFDWNAAGLVSGVYYYRMTAGNFAETKNLCC